MRRRLMIMTMAIALIAGAGAATAHEKYRIIGTITKVTADTLEVKQSKDGKVIAMDVNLKTKVSRAKTRLRANDLKLGQSVVVNAVGDSIDELLVTDVTIVPAATKN